MVEPHELNKMDKTYQGLKCSFCNKPQDMVKLIAGPGVFICNECVDLCNEILDEELFEGQAENSAVACSTSSARDLMTGRLDQIEPANLLKAISVSGLECTLTVEGENSLFVMTFAQGRPVGAGSDQFSGYEAVIDFLVSWTKGKFRVCEGGTALDEHCAVRESLETLLEDAAKKKKS